MKQPFFNMLHMLYRFDAQQIQVIAKHLTHQGDQGKPTLLFRLVRFVDNPVIMVEFGESV